MHLVAEGGMSNFSFPKLTASTGIVAPTIYELFKNKEELLGACFMEIDADIGRLLASSLERTPPHRNQVEDVERYCWLLWAFYWHYLTMDADRTLFYWTFYNSEYYTRALAEKRDQNFLRFAQYVDEIDVRFNISGRCNRHVLLVNMIEGTMNDAVRVLRGEYENDSATVETIYQSVFQPIYSILGIDIKDRCAG